MNRTPRPTPLSPTPGAPLGLGGTLDKAVLNSLPLDRRAALLGAQSVLKAYAPDIPKPPLPAEIAPVLGPAWQAVDDFQDGRYFGATANAALAGIDALSVGAGSAGIATVGAIAKELTGKAMTGPNVQKAARVVAGADGNEWQAHHTIPLKGIPYVLGPVPREVESWRHHLALMKVLPTVTHQRWHGAKGGFGPLARAWYGTTNLMKAAAAESATAAAETAEHFMRGRQPPAPSQNPGRQRR